MFKVGDVCKSRDGKREYTVLQMLNKGDFGGYSIVSSFIDNDEYIKAETFTEKGKIFSFDENEDIRDMMPNIPKPKFKVGDRFAINDGDNEIEVRFSEYCKFDEQYKYMMKNAITGSLFLYAESSLSHLYKLK